MPVKTPIAESCEVRMMVPFRGMKNAATSTRSNKQSAPAEMAFTCTYIATHWQNARARATARAMRKASWLADFISSSAPLARWAFHSGDLVAGHWESPQLGELAD